jgi:hypothetical protein
MNILLINDDFLSGNMPKPDMEHLKQLFSQENYTKNMNSLIIK